MAGILTKEILDIIKKEKRKNDQRTNQSFKINVSCFK
jgi:hypothetical protein